MQGMINNLCIYHAITNLALGVTILSYSISAQTSLTFDGIFINKLRNIDHHTIKIKNFVQGLLVLAARKTTTLSWYALCLTRGPC